MSAYTVKTNTAHTTKTDSELYVYINNKLIYKRWYKPDSLEKRASRIFNEQWPDVVLPVENES